jgi:uncharacterized membrane-anchored protein
MLKNSLLVIAALHVVLLAWADKPKKKPAKEPLDSVTLAMQHYLQFADSVNKVIEYKTGIVKLKDLATLNIPAGFKYVNAEQSQFIIHKVWENPKRDDILGMLFPEDGNPFKDSSYAFIISFDDMGYVEDKDAAKIDYRDLLKDIQEGEEEANKSRAAAGYETIHLVRWAQQPFYDEKRKVLHWAKELEFGGNTEEHTLNYDVRVLGRKGVLSFNAVASVSELPLVKQNIDAVLKMASFAEGNAYADYNSGTDKIAAYTIGGLVAGKVLAKVGLGALILKFGKLIGAAVLALFYGIRKFLTGRKRKEEESWVPEQKPAEELPAPVSEPEQEENDRLQNGR